MPSKTVMEVTNWDSMYDMYKINLVKLFYNIVSDKTPPLISDLAMWREAQYNLRGHKKVPFRDFRQNSGNIPYVLEAPYCGTLFPII